MKKTLFLSAILATALCSSAFAFNSTTTTIDGTTYNGDVWTWNNFEDGENLSSTNSKYTNYTTGDEYAGQKAPAPSGVSNFFNVFFDTNANVTNYVGNTLRFDGAANSIRLNTDFNTYVWIGGIITTTSTVNDLTYTLGRNDKSTFRLNGANDVNMSIGSNFTMTTITSITVEKGGTWNIADGKTLTLKATGASSDQGVLFSNNEKVSLSGTGTLNIVVNENKTTEVARTSGNGFSTAKYTIGDHLTQNSAALQLNNRAATFADGVLTADSHTFYVNEAATYQSNADFSDATKFIINAEMTVNAAMSTSGGFFHENVVINKGGSIIMNGKDLMGWGGTYVKALTLEDGALIKMGHSGNETFNGALTMKGTSTITGSNAQGQAIGTWDIHTGSSITVADNAEATISTNALRTRRTGATITVGKDASLLVSAQLTRDGGDGIVNKAGTGMLTFAGGMNSGNTTLTINNNAGTTVIDGGTLTGTIGMKAVTFHSAVINNSTLTLSGNIDYNGTLTLVEVARSGDNGFGTLRNEGKIIARGSGSTNTDAVTGWTINGSSEGVSYSSGAVYTEAGASTIYYLNTGTMTLTEAKELGATGVGVSNNSKLVVNEDANTDFLRLSGKVEISAKKTLTAGSSNKSLTLSGAGTYAVTTSTLMRGATLAEDWTGWVSLSGADACDFTSLGQRIEMNGFSGWNNHNNSAWYGTADQNFNLKNGSDGFAWKNRAFASKDGKDLEFTGTWSGDGKYIAYAVGSSSGNAVMRYEYSGDISKWTGVFESQSDASGYVGLTLSGDASAMNAEVKKESGTLKLTVNTTEAATFAKDVSANTVTLHQSATFKGSFSTGSLTIAEEKSATLVGAATTIDTLTLNNGSKLTLGSEAKNGHDYALTTSALTVSGECATMNANLVVDRGSMTFENGAILTMGCDVTIGDGVKVYITGDVASIRNGLDTVTIIDGLTSLDEAHLGDALIYVNGTKQDDFFLDTVEDTVYGGYKIVVAPEPATATLSLLALAALAARRKRH